MVKVFREEPLFIKIRKQAKDFPQWIHLRLPQGRYKVNAPLQHRLICKEAMLVPELSYSSCYGGAGVGVTPDSLGAPHNHLYLEATTAASVSTSHDHLYGQTENEELLKSSTKFAKLTLSDKLGSKFNRDDTGESKKGLMTLNNEQMVYACNRLDNAYAFNLGSNDETSLHLRIADCEGHGLYLLSAPLPKRSDGFDQFNLFEGETVIELTISLVYQVFVQDVEMPQHPKEGLTGYYRTAITEPLSNI